MSEQMDPREFTFIKQKIRQLTGVDLNNYKSPQVQRRLRTYLLRSGYKSWSNYFRANKEDEAELTRLKNYLTINVSSFLRDPQKFAYLKTHILPDLLKQRARLRVWSAGCSFGQEPYSLAILLAEATSPYRRHEILATDIDRAALAFAGAGGPYDAAALVNIAPELRARYFRPGETDNTYYVTDVLRKMVTLKHHDILNDPFEQDFDLIVCRNVVIYFTREVKERLYKRLHDALRPGGVLFVGGAEVIFRTLELGFEPSGISFYRRIDD